jgi:undecaprenyl-diphosphatase
VEIQRNIRGGCLNDYLLAVILGVVEGLTEFLPVSSTAHLRISEALLGMDLSNGYWKMFSIVIQLGAILSLFFFFWKRLIEFIATFPKGSKGSGTIWTHPLTLVFIAFVCTAGPAYILTKVIDKHLENIKLMAGALVVGGIVMIVVDLMYSSADGIRILTGRITDHIEDMRLWQAIWIGLCQILSAVIPGTSRSMVTIAGGQLAGMTRTAALEFSFFLSIPTMLMATLYELYRSIKPGKNAPPGTESLASIHMGSHEWIVLAIGGVVSFVVALLVVAWFMNWVRKRGFVAFGVYRIVIGIVVWFWLAGVGTA